VGENSTTSGDSVLRWRLRTPAARAHTAEPAMCFSTTCTHDLAVPPRARALQGRASWTTGSALVLLHSAPVPPALRSPPRAGARLLRAAKVREPCGLGASKCSRAEDWPPSAELSRGPVVGAVSDRVSAACATALRARAAGSAAFRSPCVLALQRLSCFAQVSKIEQRTHDGPQALTRFVRTSWKPGVWVVHSGTDYCYFCLFVPSIVLSDVSRLYRVSITL